MTILSLLALIAAAAPSDTAKTDSVAITPIQGRGPLEPGAWGLGFRAYGFAPEIRIRRALSDRLSVGVDASWWGSYSEQETERTGNSWSSVDTVFTEREIVFTEKGEESNSNLRIGIPIEWVFRCRGELCVVGSAGPVYELYTRENQTELPGGYNATGDIGRFSWNESMSHEVGATGSLGVRWEFLPGLALASSLGADVWYAFGEVEGVSNSYSRYPSHSANNTSSTGFGTRSWFGGIGLDAWF